MQDFGLCIAFVYAAGAQNKPSLPLRSPETKIGTHIRPFQPNVVFIGPFLGSVFVWGRLASTPT